MAALAIDFALCFIIYWAFFYGNDWASLLIFAAEQILLLATTGSGFGHMIMGIRLARLNGGSAGVWRPIVRTALLVLLIPALVWDSDQRGLHDVFAGTVLVMRR
jgi:uncharacterized RDD family membrane protein YckC